MLSDSITPKTYRLLNTTTTSLPSLIHPQCDGGLERLKRLLEEDSHVSYGIYFKSGSAMYVQCLDGEIIGGQRENVVSMVTQTTNSHECAGYYFIHPSEEELMNCYSHYFIPLT